MSIEKDFIANFRKNDFGLDELGKPTGIPEHVRSSFEQALGIVSKDLYSDDLHFVYELIQNAQDNRYEAGVTPNLKFHLLADDPTRSEGAEGCLCVINNEAGFSEEDIKSICSSGKSTKKLKKVEGFIGEKGIGFKSVFKVSDFPHIFSNGFNIKLLGEDKLTGLSYIIPYWVDDTPDIVKENIESTCILLPLQKGKYSDINTSLKKHKPESTLFLDKLKRVEIHVPSDSYKAVFEENIEGDVLTISSSVSSGEPTFGRFLLSEKKVSVPEELNEEKRQGVAERTISVAFPLQKYKSFSVFGYLPTEMRSGLPFIINADFLMAANRESINNTKWNDWLIEEIAIFVASEIVRFAITDKIGPKVYGFIPKISVNEASGSRFISLAKGVVSALKPEAFVKVDRQKYCKPQLVRSINKDFRRLFLEAEHQTHWLAEDVSSYSGRLKEVGVDSLTQEEEEAYYYQVKFVERQDDAWFVTYYQFLAKLNNRETSGYPILPLETSGLAKKSGAATYSPVNLVGSDSDLSGHFFPLVQTFRETLFSRIKSRTDAAQIFAYLSLKEFSFSHYFFEVVLPSVKSRVESSSLHERKALVLFLFTWWKVLDIDENNVLSDYGLPVLLSSGDLVLSNEYEGQFVVPEGASQDSGWELVFSTDKEKEKFAVLHQWYLCLDYPCLDEYYDEVGVKEYPDPVNHYQKGPFRVSDVEAVYQTYANAVNSQYFYDFGRYNSNYEKIALIPLLPSILWDLDSLSDKSYEAMVGYFSSLYVEGSPNRKLKTKLEWFYRKDRSEMVDSPYDYYLKELPWLKTTDGFRKPSECFVDDPNLRLIFGDGLPYVVAPASDELLDCFDVKRDAETSTIIDYLCGLSSSNSVAVDTAFAIYGALSSRDDLVSGAFDEYAIIFIPAIDGEPAQWCTSAEVIWDDISELTDESIFESLQPHYPEELKYFFVTELGVKESIDASSFSDLWLNLQRKTYLNERDWVLYCKAFSNVRAVVRNGDRPDWLHDFKASAKLYSDRNSWISINDDQEPFLPDQPILRAAFTTKIPFIKRIDDHSYEWMLPLVKYMGFDCFSEVVDEVLVSNHIDSLLSRNRYLTDFSIKLLVRLVANKVGEGREIVEKLKGSGLLESLLNFRETEVDNIQVRVFIPHTKIETLTSNHNVFLDFEKKILFVKRDADPDDIKDDLERLIITRVLGGITYRQEREAFEDSISRLLGVGTEKRYKKLTEKKSDWHIPREILTFIDWIIKERSSHLLEKKLVDKAKEKGETMDSQERGAHGGPALTVTPDKIDSTSVGETAEGSGQNELDSGGGPSLGGDNGISGQYGSVDDAHSSIRSASSGGDFDRRGSTSAGGGNRSSSHESRLRSKPARSKNTASNINQARRSRLMSYVVSDLTESEEYIDSADSIEQQEYRKKIGEKAELIVLDALRSHGFIADRMPINNPGYDIEAINPETGELLFFEVKGDSSSWSNKGVGITARQYHVACDKAGSYYLAIVDNLASIPSEPKYIRDPVSCITEYRFDAGWSELVTPLHKISSAKPAESVLEEMLQYTDVVESQSLLKYCEEMTYPFPDIGAELQDETGAVVLENIELLWENEKIIVFIDAAELAASENYRDDWDIFLSGEQAGIRDLLDQKFGGRS